MIVLYTPTVEATVDEAFEEFSRHTTTASHWGLGARGRDGKKSLRCSASAGFTREHAAVEATANRPFRFSCDVHFETIANTADARFLALFNPLHTPGSTGTSSMASRLGLTAVGKLYVTPELGNTIYTDKTLRAGEVYAVEVEMVRAANLNGLIRVWVDGEKVVEFTGQTTTTSSRTSIVAARFESLATATSGGVHFSNILIGEAEGDQIGVPFGPLDFAYVPVQDADLGGTVTSDDTFATFTDSVFREYPLSADAREGAGVAWAPRLRAGTDGSNPGTLDLRAGDDDVLSRMAVSGGFATYRPSGRAGEAPAAISIRNSPPL